MRRRRRLHEPARAHRLAIPDGREVSNYSEEWKAHCLARHNARRQEDAAEIGRHVETLGRLPDRHSRAGYLETLERRDPWMWMAVKSEFLKRWEAAQAARRKAQQRMSAEGVA